MTAGRRCKDDKVVQEVVEKLEKGQLCLSSELEELPNGREIGGQGQCWMRMRPVER